MRVSDPISTDLIVPKWLVTLAVKLRSRNLTGAVSGHNKVIM